ncbi:MAG: hypothetical protein A3B30_03555, partial [Candidatus Komeilibacteria bacterium RIFCSPLOWO2_01_FULL_52_15]
MQKKRRKIVVIGGGTGTFTVLTGLKKYPVDLTAIVSMADDGGSTGILRDELGVLPPGDVRQCLVALSKSDRLMRRLMQYRFTSGGLKGHTFGNIFLSALEKLTGSFDEAVEKAAEILRLRGTVIPATLTKTKLVAYLNNGIVLRGQHLISVSDLSWLKKVSLKPAAKANPKALRAIRDADYIVVGPGDVYSSIIPHFLIADLARTVADSKAIKIYVCNLMNRAGQTDNFSPRDYLETAERYSKARFQYVIYNTENPKLQLLKRYMREGEHPVATRVIRQRRFIGGK